MCGKRDGPECSRISPRALRAIFFCVGLRLEEQLGEELHLTRAIKTLLVPDITPKELSGEVTNGEMQPSKLEPEGVVVALHLIPLVVAPGVMNWE